MQDMSRPVHDTDGPRAEHAGLLHEPAQHDAVSRQQVVHRIGVELIQALIDLIGILDLGDVLGRGQDALPIQNGRDLLQA